MNDINVGCVLVTYNRLELLKCSLDSLFNQTYTLSKIIVVDNASNDGTYEYLSDLHVKGLIEHIRLEKNVGGSGGFYEGIKKSISNNIDWIWIMDDDTICRNDSLEKLVKSIKGINKIGFICSKVLWRNGDIHQMNIPVIKNIINGNPFNKFKKNLIIESCSFVSVMISKDVILKVGLPYKEFFIWADDSEYTKRITDNKYIGLYCDESVVEHHTVTNYNTNIMKDTPNNYWKYEYGIRNLLFLLKKENIVKYIIKLIYNILILVPRILISNKEKKFKLANIVIKSTVKSIIFNPKIDYIEY